jgi:hypothetical protein
VGPIAHASVNGKQSVLYTSRCFHAHTPRAVPGDLSDRVGNSRSDGRTAYVSKVDEEKEDTPKVVAMTRHRAANAASTAGPQPHERRVRSLGRLYRAGARGGLPLRPAPWFDPRMARATDRNAFKKEAERTFPHRVEARPASNRYARVVQRERSGLRFRLDDREPNAGVPRCHPGKAVSFRSPMPDSTSGGWQRLRDVSSLAQADSKTCSSWWTTSTPSGGA